MPLKLKEIMVKDVVTVNAEATVKKAVEVMNNHEIGCLVVVSDGKPVGIVTERDMLKKVIQTSRESENMKVVDIMSRPLIFTSPKTSAGDAAKLMFESKIKKLPVVEDEQLMGLVTLTDLIGSQEVLNSLNGFSANELPKRMKKKINLYFIRDSGGLSKRRTRRCPLISRSGDLVGCQTKKCMWWLGNECAFTRLSRQMPLQTSDSEGIEPQE